MFARTKRLTLRPGWPEDAAALARAIAHEAVVTKLSHAPWPYAEQDAMDFLSRPHDANDATLLMFVNDGTIPRLIGCIGVQAEQDGHELGYWLTPGAWGRGYATEAGRHMIDVARWSLGLKALRVGHFVDNPRSARVIQKLGFRPTGQVVPQYCRARGREVACVKHVLDLAGMSEGDPTDDMPIAA